MVLWNVDVRNQFFSSSVHKYSSPYEALTSFLFAAAVNKWQEADGEIPEATDSASSLIPTPKTSNTGALDPTGMTEYPCPEP